MRMFFVALAVVATPAMAQTASQQAPAVQTLTSKPDPYAAICARWETQYVELKKDSDWWDKKKKKKKPDPELEASFASAFARIEAGRTDCKARGL